MQNAQHEDREQTVALLEMLALGRQEIETGKFTSAIDVFAELDRMDRDERLA